MSVLAFAIEAIPDVTVGRCRYGLDGTDVIRAMRQLRRQRVVAMSRGIISTMWV